MKKYLSIIIICMLILSISAGTLAQSSISLDEKVELIQNFTDERQLDTVSLKGFNKEMNLEVGEVQYKLSSNKDNCVEVISENYQYNIILSDILENISIHENFALYSNSTDDLVNFVEITKLGVLISTPIFSESSLKEFDFNIEIKDGGYMKYSKYEDGSNSGAVEVYRNDDLISIIYPLEVKDANGNLIENDLIIDGNTLKQVIHANDNSIYPIMGGLGTYERASGFYEYFDSGQWITRDEGISLSLYHQDWWFVRGQQQYLWPMAWATVVDRFSGGYRWGNTNGMKDQFLCHVEYAVPKRKTPWNLEPWRPDVGYTRTVLAGCNPE